MSAAAAPLLVVGQAVLDHVFRVAGFSAEGGKSVAESHAVRLGGLAAQAARAAQTLRDPRHSPPVRLHTAVGDDAAGVAVQGLLRSGGLDATLVPGARTGVSAVLVDPAGERQVHNVRGDALARAPLPPAEACAGVLADPRWPAAAAAALTRARAAGAPAVLDAEVAEPAVLQALLPLASWSVFSRAGLEAWACGAGEPAALLARAAQVAPDAELIVTLGAQGLLWRRPGGRLVALPAFRVPVVDTNGAGDVLHGALALSLAEGQPADTAVRRAMAAAALACRGDWPTRAELDHFLEDTA
jgi:sulfofructose kinase